MSDAYQRVVWRGKTFNKRTVAALQAAERRLGRPIQYIVQGSYNGSVGASAGTHDGGGAVDCDDSDLEAVERALRAVGFAAWHRPAIPGLWGSHVHAILIGDAEMSSGARSQVVDYYNHRDGLASHRPDWDWRPNPIPVFNYYGQAETPWDGGNVYVFKLQHGMVDSDSVKRLQYRLENIDAHGTRNLGVDGDYGDKTKAAVRKWQRAVAENDPKDGSRVTFAQAKRLFGDKAYNVIEPTDEQAERLQKR